MAYSNGWNSTDQVAQRAIDQGLIGRFGSLDPTDGGTSSRVLAVEQLGAVERVRPDQGQRLCDPLVAATVQQFHLLPRRSRQWRPVQPDRPPHGLWVATPATPSTCAFAGIETQTRIGLQTRGDDITCRTVQDVARETLSTVREDNVKEGNVGLWADTTARWTDWLRTTVGIREDYFAGRVVSDTPQNSGNAQASMTSPKAGIVLGPWYKHRVLRQCRLRPALQRYPRRDHHRRSQRQGDAARSRAAAGALQRRRDRYSHQGDRRSHQFACGVRARFRFRTAVRRRRRHHRAEPAQPPCRRRMDQPVQGAAVDDAGFRSRLYPRPLHQFRSGRRFHPGRAGVGRQRRRDVWWRERLVRRAACALFRSASADRGRQRPFAAIADLQCARRLQIRQRHCGCSSTC